MFKNIDSFMQLHANSFRRMHTNSFPHMHTDSFPHMHTDSFPHMHTGSFPHMHTQYYDIRLGNIPISLFFCQIDCYLCWWCWLIGSYFLIVVARGGWINTINKASSLFGTKESDKMTCGHFQITPSLWGHRITNYPSSWMPSGGQSGSVKILTLRKKWSH